MTGQRIMRFALSLAGLALAIWLAGFWTFVQQVKGYVEPVVDEALSPVEAIVVLTGGSERLSMGVELLRQGKGRKLFISGVYPGVGHGRVLAHDDVPEDLRDCCVVLGHAADNTFGNAVETLAFMKAEGFHSLRLVTAHYHMPRSLLLFHEILGDVEIVPHPVSPDTVDLAEWWRRPGTASLLFSEYNKYLFAQMRVALEVL